MWKDDSAAASALAFIAAGLVFTAAIGLILYNVSNKVGSPAVNPNIAGSSGSARSLLGQILDTGTGWNTPAYPGSWHRTGTFYPGILEENGAFSLERFVELDDNDDGLCDVVADNDCIEMTANRTGLWAGDIRLTFQFVVDHPTCVGSAADPGTGACTYGSDLPQGSIGTSSASTRVAASGGTFATVTVYVFPG